MRDIYLYLKYTIYINLYLKYFYFKIIEEKIKAQLIFIINLINYKLFK